MSFSRNWGVMSIFSQNIWASAGFILVHERLFIVRDDSIGALNVSDHWVKQLDFKLSVTEVIFDIPSGSSKFSVLAHYEKSQNLFEFFETRMSLLHIHALSL